MWPNGFLTPDRITIIPETAPSVRGTAANDELNGSALDDQIEGFKGHDVIRGEGGNDRLFGGLGRDQLYGGGGNDSSAAMISLRDGIGWRYSRFCPPRRGVDESAVILGQPVRYQMRTRCSGGR